jgi:hypothetical protein
MTIWSSEIRDTASESNASRGHGPLLLSLGLLLLSVIGCRGDRDAQGNGRVDTRRGAGPLSLVSLDTSNNADGGVPRELAGARNEWLGIAVEVAQWHGGRHARLRVRLLDDTGRAVAPASNVTVEQLADVPVDQHRASFVRQTGATPTRAGRLPRALLPVARTSAAGDEWDLSRLRDPALLSGAAQQRMADGQSPVLLWIDVHIPAETPAGNYMLAIELLERPQARRAVATLVAPMTVHDFVLPDERTLDLVARLDWPVLAQQVGVAQVFGDLPPRLLNRSDARCAPAVRTLDALVATAQAHRVSLFVPQLHPTVKWPSGEPPAIDWRDFDSIAGRWLSGEAFSDRVPLGFWPLPAPDGLDAMDDASRAQYWADAASHFAQQDWLNRSAVALSSAAVGRASASQSIDLSFSAAKVLAAHPLVRAMVPIDADQVQFTESMTGVQLVSPAVGGRLMVTIPGLVATPPAGSWPRESALPVHWLRAGASGVASPSAASEGDVRLWGWLAFLRDARLVLFDNPLPPPDVSPTRPLDPTDALWFYPGQPFGRDGFVPSVQLKWLRRAQQDFEYLRLATQRGETTNTRLVAQLLTRPVGIPPTTSVDPVYNLFTGAPTPADYTGAMRLIARAILLRQPGRLPDLTVQQQLQMETLRWMQPQQQPTLVGRSTTWLLDPLAARSGNWLEMKCGLDLYTTATGDPVAASTLQWTGVGAGWRVQPQPTPLTALSPYRVRRVTLGARVDLDQLGPDSRQPLSAVFTDGFTRRQAAIDLVIPAAACDRRQEPLTLDGSLGDWRELDAIASDPLVRMLDRPGLLQPRVQRMSTPARIYANWTEGSLNVAFRLEGVVDGGAAQNRPMRNFVTYDQRRAWGEDVAEVLVQPIYADNSVGPVLNVTCKPTAVWTERKQDARTSLDPWAPLEGAAVRYAARVDNHVWRGEIAIPWKAVGDPEKGRPVLLRFNLSQHRGANAESGSWAGPVDFGRDDAFMGVLHVREE